MKDNSQHTIETILKQTYQHFNDRTIDPTLAVMHPDVDWPNGMEGGVEHGHEAVRKYWTRQWAVIDPHVEPVQFDREEEGRIKVTVHQVVHDVNRKLLIDQMIHHIYKTEDDLIKSMEIKKTN